jgi:hypothetical protein
MFFEDVPITSVIGTTPAQIFAQYGIDPARFSQVIRLPENEPLRRSSSSPLRLDSPLQAGLGSIRIPIDPAVTVVRTAAHVDMTDGLRPLPIVNGVVDRSSVHLCTHGVDVVLDRTGLPCNRIRWLQTVRKRNNPDRLAPLEFVDVGGNDLPWYNASASQDPIRFDDTPCGPAAPTTAAGLDFLATVSLAVWTMERITLILGYTYGFRIVPGTTRASVHWHPPLHPASAAELANQIRILELGINQFRRPTGGHLLYNPVPAASAINDGLLFGRD